MAPKDTSIIAAGTVIRGRIQSDGDLEIHGHVEGTVEVAGHLVVGPDGMVKSDLAAQSVVVAGAVSGNLRGSERVVLEDGARVVGDVSAPSIGIRPGAKLRGRVATGEAPATEARPARSPAAAVASKSTARQAPVVAPPPRVAAKVSAPPVTKPAATPPAVRAEAAPKRAPEPVVPALQKRTKKAQKRRAR